jgi:hypothetical protein
MLKRHNVLALGMVWSVALMPLLGTFSTVTLFGGFTLNWVSYLPVVFGLLFYFLSGSRWPKLALLSLLAIVIFLTSWFLQAEQVNTLALLRFALSLLPLLLTAQLIGGIEEVDLKLPAVIFAVGVAVTIVLAFMQLAGVLEYRDFDYVDGVQIGRISGGYEKPVIFTVVLFPVYLLAVSLYSSRRAVSLLVITAIVGIVYLSGLRTALVVYMFLTVLLVMKLDLYVLTRYFLKILGPTLLAVFLVTLLWVVGELLPGAGLLRGRLGMWIAHANEFYGAGGLRIIFGSGNTFLDPATLALFDVYHSNEVHNDFIRILVYCGFAGSSVFSYLLYRHFDMTKRHLKVSAQDRNLLTFPVIFLLLYMITNEPSFYPSFFWLLVMSALLTIEMKRRRSLTVGAR